MANCKHWKDCGIKGGGCCALKLFGGKPSEGVCRKACQQREAIDPNIPKEVYTNIATYQKPKGRDRGTRGGCGCGRGK